MRHGGMPRLIEPIMASLRRGLPHDDDRSRAPGLRAAASRIHVRPGVSIFRCFTGGQSLLRLYTRTPRRLAGAPVTPGPDDAVVRHRGHPGGQPGQCPGRGGRQAAGLGLPSRPAPGLDQDQEHPARRGHHLRLDTRPGPPSGHDRLAAGRGLGRAPAAVRRARRHRFHPGRPRRPDTPPAAVAPRRTARSVLRCPPNTPAARSGCTRSWSARSPSRVDQRQGPASSQLARARADKNPGQIRRRADLSHRASAARLP